MKRRSYDAVNEGLADYAAEREERDARENLGAWATAASAPVGGDDCGVGAYARGELGRAWQRAREAGVFEDQPGEAGWLTMHRWERDGEAW
jgi:hypothetical protein